MERIVRRLSGDYSITLDGIDATGVDIDITGTPTATITAPDGSAVTGATVALTSGNAVVSVPVESLPGLGKYAGVAVVTIAGVTQSIAFSFELVGGFYFEPYELRAFTTGGKADLSSTATYPDATINDRRTGIEQTIERYLGFALVPRGNFFHEDVTTYTDELELPHERVTRVISITVDGTALTVTELAALTIHKRYGRITGSSWGAGQAVTCWYEHGDDEPDRDVVIGAMKLCINRLIPSATPDNATSLATDVGSFRIATADGDRYPTGLLDLDAVLKNLKRGVFVG
jgi:hypothetical protein